MQKFTKHILSVLLVLMLVLSMVPTMALAAEGMTAAAANISTGVEYATVDAALNEAVAGQVVQLSADSQESVTFNKENVILDLNGHSLTNVTVPAGVTVTAIDSATDDYKGSYGTLSGAVEGEIAATVKTTAAQTGTAKSYVALCENGSWSFHRYYAAITAISLKPAQAALGYKAQFYGDEAVKNAVVNYGYELWINDYAHQTRTRSDALESSILTLRLQNILVEGNNGMNDLGSTAAISGKAFITLNLNGQQVTLSSTAQQTTLRQTVEAINGTVSSYTEAQLEAVRTLCTTYAAWMEGWATENIFGNGGSEGTEPEGGLDVEITVDVTAENNVVTEDATLSNDTVSAQVPQGVLLDDNTTQLVLTIAEKESSESGVEVAEGQTILPLDVHIQGVSKDNTAPITVCLGAVLPEGLNIGNYKLYHVENGEAVEMTRVYALAELDAHNEFYYEPATGYVTVSVASFSEFSLFANEENIWNGEIATGFSAGSGTEDDPYIIANADQLAYMSKAVSDDTDETNYAEACYKLIADVNFGGSANAEDENGAKNVFYPIGYWKLQEGTNAAGEAYYGYGHSFQGVFDGNGNTVANIYQNTWLMDGNYDNGYWDDAMGLFGATFNATVKNLTIDNFQSDGEFTPTGCVAAFAGGDMTFENIYLNNCNPRVYNTGNGGIVGLNYNSTSGTPDNIVFKNITVDQTNKITALWGSWDVGCGGIMGRLRENSKHTGEQKNHVTFENCHVAAIIDVYNDVCANYQYYQYRYAGMMIGTVDYIGEVDHLGIEDVVTATGCTATYGDWNEYWYCELVSNSIASYTNDFQFSRLTKITSIEDISDDNGLTWKQAGNFVIPNTKEENAQCFHIVKDEEGNLYRHQHEDAGIDTGYDVDKDGEDDLKENRQHYYLPFGQLFTGYGWGSSPVHEFDGIVVSDGGTVKAQQKFVSTGTEVYEPGRTYTLGDLFAVADEAIQISSPTVYVAISPADPEDTTTEVIVTYSGNTTDWQLGTLTFDVESTGAAKIVITDYFYCTNTVIVLEPEAVKHCLCGNRYEDQNGIVHAIGPCQTGADGSGCDGTIYTWTAWTDSTELPSAAGKYYLATDVTLTKAWDFNNKAMYLDLNGHTVTGAASKQTIMLGESGKTAESPSDRVTKLVITDRKGTGVIQTGTDIVGSVLRTRTYNPYLTVEIYGGTFRNTADNCTIWGPVIAHCGGTLNIFDATVIGVNVTTEKLYGGALCINNGATCNMYGGELIGGTGYKYGGAVAVVTEASSFNMYGGLITDGSATYGNAIFTEGSVVIDGGSIDSDYALTENATQGGIFHIQENGSVTVNEGYFSRGLSVAASDANDAQVAKVLNDILADGRYLYVNGVPYTPEEGHASVTGIIAVAESDHQHCVCNGELNGQQDHSCTNVYWMPWTSSTSLPSTSGYYYLTTNVTLSKGTSWGGKDIALCLNGYTVTGAASNSQNVEEQPQTIVVGNINNNDSSKTTKLAITDCSGEQTGKITSASNQYGAVLRMRKDAGLQVDMYAGTLDATHENATASGGAVAVYGGVFNMYGGTLDGYTTKSSGGTLYVEGTANLYGGNITGGTVTDQSSGGGNIYAYGGTVNLAGATVTGGIATGDDARGGNILVVSGSFTMTAGEVTGGSATGSRAYGGNVYFRNSTAELTGGTVSGGSAVYGAGNIYAFGSDVNLNGVNVTDGTVTGNGRMGGNLWVNSGTVNLISGTVSGGHAAHGGNLRLVGGTLKISGATVENGVAATNGGNLSMTGGTLEMTDGVIRGGTASNSGGNIYANGGSYSLTGGIVENGVAQSGNGGNIYFEKNGALGAVTVSGGSAVNGYGGSIYVGANATVEINGTTVTNTTESATAKKGGVIYCAGSLTVIDAVITGGKASNDGNCILVQDGSLIMESGTVTGVDGTDSQNGGAVYLDGTASFTMNGGTIYGGSGYYRGGAVAVNGTESVFTMNGGSIVGGSATFGNAIATAGNVYINGGIIDCDITTGATLQIRGEGAYHITACSFPQGLKTQNCTLASMLEEGRVYTVDGIVMDTTAKPYELSGNVAVVEQEITDVGDAAE